MAMFAGFARRLPFLPDWRWSTGAAQVVATPKWRDLVRARPEGLAGPGWDMITDDSAIRRAGGQILHLFGQVMDFDGNLLPGVTVEIWQDGPSVGGHAGAVVERHRHVGAVVDLTRVLPPTVDE